MKRRTLYITCIALAVVITTAEFQLTSETVASVPEPGTCAFQHRANRCCWCNPPTAKGI
jgi:hypothetical protein